MAYVPFQNAQAAIIYLEFIIALKIASGVGGPVSFISVYQAVTIHASKWNKI